MRLHLYILFIMIATILFGSCSLKSRIKNADKRYSQGEYFEAGNQYRYLYSSIPTTEKQLRARIAFQQGECYRLTNNVRADQPYQNSIRNKYADTLVYLRLAQVLQRTGKYTEALNNYKIYLKKDSTSLLAKNGIKACMEMAMWKTQPTHYVVRKADLFNVRSTDNFSPSFLNIEADALAFTSSRQLDKKLIVKNNTITGLPNNNLFMSRKDAVGKWEKPVLLNPEMNPLKEDQGVSCFSPDGKTMYYTRSKQVANSVSGTEIFSSTRAGGIWSTPERLKIFADSTISVAHPALSPDGQTLYFVSDYQKGLGGKDIWKAKIEKGECKYIENLGPEINTPGDEMFPTVRPNGDLYFASNGHPGYGGLDIFKATPIRDGGWAVENMGEPINSSGDDFGITFAGKGENGFFSSNRGDFKGYDAIWSFELPELAYSIEGKVTDEKGTGIPDATVKMVSNTGINTRVLTKKDGTYRIKLDKNIECVMLASARGYLNQKQTLSTQGLTESKSFTIDFKLAAIFKLVKIDNIFYEFAKWDLTPASETALQGLIKMLSDNPNITIEISANTDYIGSNPDNKILSEKRAKSVVNYLISKGIDAERLTSVGFGEEKPVVVDADLARKYIFLKENDILNEEYILKLTPEQQETCNQINRRTEFRVLKTTYKLY